MAVITVNYQSEALHRKVTFSALLPFDNNHRILHKKFKTLYLLHGYYDDHTDWLNRTRIELLSKEYELAVIMPAGENSFYIDHKNTGNLYGKFIGEELIEVTRTMFPLSDRREDTFIAGLSMGGFGAMRNGLRYHDVFSHIGALSGAYYLSNGLRSKEIAALAGDLDDLIESDANPEWLVKALTNIEDKPRIFMACGKQDFLYEDNIRFHKLLQEYDYDVTYFEEDGTHEWGFWDRNIKKILEWLPLKES